MTYGIGVEWINNYNNLNKLTHEHEDAGGFYDELRFNDGATGLFNWGDSLAWEDDFKANARGGHADQWVETADIVYFTGHGSPSGFYFRSDTPDDSQVIGDFVTSSAGNDGDLRLGHGDLEWLCLEVCNTLQMDATYSTAPTATSSTAGPTRSTGCTRSSASPPSASTSPPRAATSPPRWTAVGSTSSTGCRRSSSRAAIR